MTHVSKNYFEGPVYALGWVFAFLVVIMLFANWMVSPIFVLLSILVLTARYKLEIDLQNGVILDYLHILGLKAQVEKFKFNNLEYIYITKSS